MKNAPEGNKCSDEIEEEKVAMWETRIVALGILLACCLLSCTAGFRNAPEPELPPAMVDASTSASPPENVASQSGDVLGRCRSSPYDPKIKEIQPILLYLGYYRGTLDGCKGPKTVAAVEQFQRDSGLPLTGEVDEATEAALQEEKSRKGRTT
ncbi:MAG: peptidoglycan-binding domain-containing protein, partial [Terriglobia bacterium]